MSEDTHWFEKGVKFSQRYFHWIVNDNEKTKEKIDKYFTKEYMKHLYYTGMEIEPIDILSFSYATGFLTFLCIFLLNIVIIASYNFDVFLIDGFTLILMISTSIFLPLLLINIIASYPKTYSHYVKIHSLGDIPEIISYLVMYLKLVPNLENSVKFAASESSTPLSKDLKKMLWDMEIRVYHGINDAISSFASYWGQFSDHFKRSLHLIRSSVQEKNESQRFITLNRSLDVALDGTRELMNKFANKLHQPTMFIYSIGIMIPLAIIAMLPAAGLVGMNITIFQVFFLYDVILPMIIFFYTRKILLSRPATFNPPKIPNDHPDIIKINKKRRFALSLIIGFIVSLPGIIFLFLPYFYSENTTNTFIRFIISENGLNNYFPVTLFIIWGFTVFISTYAISVYRPYKKIRDDIKQIEKEFGDALYILGKRISEEKSPEESFVYTAKTMEGTKISEVFNQTGYNLTAMHTNIRDSLFNSEYGSLKHVYSDRVRAIMKLFVEGIQKSQKAVSISIIRIADHLKELQQVENRIKDTLYSLTSTLRSTSAIFAPLIAGVTLAITKLITTIIESMSGKLSTDVLGDSNSVLSGVTSSFSLENIRPEFFTLVVGIYIIELVFLLTRFTNGIDEGDDKVEYMYMLGRVLPTATIVLTVTIVISQILFSSIIKNI